MTKTFSNSKNIPENSFLQGIISQAESIGKSRGGGYPTKDEQIETPADRRDWVIIAQYIMTNAGQDSTILRKATGHSVPEIIEFLQSFDSIVPDNLYEKGERKTPVAKNKLGRKTLYQILVGIANSFQEKRKNSLNQKDLDMLFGLLDPKSVHKPKNPLFLFSEVIGPTKKRIATALTT